MQVRTLMHRSRLAALLAGMLLSAGVQAATWQEGSTYTAGAVVDYNGKTYTALVTHTAYVGANWNPAATPTLWKEGGNSSATPAPTAVPSVAPTVAPTTAPTTAPSSAPTATPVAGVNGWDKATVYTGGQRVSYNGAVYEAQWWTQGDVPGAAQWGPWKLVSGAVATPTPVVTAKPTNTPVVTSTPTPVVTSTPVVTATPTPVVTPVVTATPTPAITPSPTPVGPTPTPNPNGLPKHALIGYWHNFTNPAGDTFRIRDVPAEWDVIMISFADDAGNGAVAFNLDKNAGTEAEFIADVAAKRAQGKKVVLSLGGQEGRMTLSTKENVTNFVNSLHAIITKYGFDGIDLDLESGAGVVLGTPIINNLIDAVKQLKAKVGPSFYLSMAPEHPYVQGGYVSYSGIWGAYLPIIDGLRNDLNIIHVQYYNNGGLWTPYSNGALNEGTVDGLVGGSLMLIEGFKTVGGTGWEFKGLRPDQVAFGVPSGRSSANTGFVTSQVVNDTLTCLTQLKNCGMVKPKQAYPDYRGVMTWSINWDKHDGYNFSKPASAALKALP
ncbi:chitinase [Chitinibacter sp. ZOR0017]|uniref:chitinase n=1 Tax=Chitinibacter sp. ZOR0017 TaxID=1339254 RepID=UPI000B0B59F8|nr:carbohydrate-binding protein [Chitinibacter sp. ZOR0017]